MNHELCINATDGSGLGSRNSRISAMTRSRSVRCQPETLLNTAGWLDPGATEGLLGRMGAVHAVVRSDSVSGGGRSHGTVFPFRIARACRRAADLGPQQLISGREVQETLRHQ